MLFIGHTRFSIFEPGSSAWFASNGTQFSSREAYREYLYSDDRLKLRADIFIGYSLPQLKLASTNHRIRHIVAYSDSLPIEYQRKLQDAAVEFPFLVLDRGTDERKASIPGARRWEELVTSMGEGETLIGTYRLDDDDVLPVDYFDQMAPYMRDSNVGMQVSLGSGITALYESSQVSNVRRYYSAMSSAGLMSVCSIDNEGTLQQPVKAPHHLADRSNPVILDSRRTGFLRFQHLTQDGALRNGESDPSKMRTKMISSINRNPTVSSVEEIKALFPAIGDRFVADEDSSTEMIIANARTLTENPWRMVLPEHGRHVRLTTLLRCSDNASRGNALMSFDLRKIDGSKVDPSDYQDYFLAQKISYSKNVEIGFYRYLKTAPGLMRTVQELVLPEGVTCKEVSLRKWKNYDAHLKAVSVSITSGEQTQ